MSTVDAASTFSKNVSIKSSLTVSLNSSKKKIGRVFHDCTNIMVPNNKKMRRTLCQSENQFLQTFSATKLNDSREITITPVHNTKNNTISVLQKKLPEITIFNVVRPKPVFKVPESPIGKGIYPKKVDTQKPKLNCKKYVLFESRENIKKPKKYTSTPKQKRKQMQNNSPFVNNNTISHNENNIKKTSVEIPENLPSISQIKLQEPTTNNAAVLYKVKTNSDNDFNKFNHDQEVKTNEALQDDNQIEQEIGKTPEKINSQFDASQSYFGKQLFAEENIDENLGGEILEANERNAIKCAKKTKVQIVPFIDTFDEFTYSIQNPLKPRK